MIHAFTLLAIVLFAGRWQNTFPWRSRRHFDNRVLQHGRVEGDSGHSQAQQGRHFRLVDDDDA